MTRQINDAGLELIKSFEQLRLHVYTDAVGVRTIGWGHALHHGENLMQISPEQADQILRDDLTQAENAVMASITPNISDNAYSACVSLAFNIGGAAFHGSSVAHFINVGQLGRAADSFLLWNKGTVAGHLTVLAGLTRRRTAERALFLKVEGSV